MKWNDWFYCIVSVQKDSRKKRTQCPQSEHSKKPCPRLLNSQGLRKYCKKASFLNVFVFVLEVENIRIQTRGVS